VLVNGCIDKIRRAYYISITHVILSCCFVKTHNYENSSQACCLVGLICAFSGKVGSLKSTCWNTKTYPLPNAEYTAQTNIKVNTETLKADCHNLSSDVKNAPSYFLKAFVGLTIQEVVWRLKDTVPTTFYFICHNLWCSYASSREVVSYFL
jgi:hypothetical protein